VAYSHRIRNSIRNGLLEIITNFLPTQPILQSNDRHPLRRSQLLDQINVQLPQAIEGSIGVFQKVQRKAAKGLQDRNDHE
jgi:hypothetical protein